MRLMKKILFLGVLVAVAYFAYTRFFAAPPGAPGMMGGGAMPPPVEAAEVISRKIRQWREFSGRLVAVESAEIRPQVSGLIETVLFKEGEKVEKGQPLFTIDPRPYQAALDAAQARHTLAASELERAKTLLAEKAIPQREYDQRKNAAEVARADLTRAKLDFEHTLIESPVAGRVSRAEITAGNLVDVGMPVLTTVVSDTPIYADFDIDETSFLTYLQAVGPDTEKLKSVPVTLGLSGEEGAPHEGRVQSFDNRLNPATGTLRVRAVFDNEDGALIPGLFARMRLGSAEETQAVLITDRAVGTDQNKKFVLVVGEGGKTERREIKLGGMADGLRIVNEGLKPGEKIIVSGMQRVMMPGQPVTPETVPMEKGAEAGGQGSGEEKKETMSNEQKPGENEQ